MTNLDAPHGDQSPSSVPSGSERAQLYATKRSGLTALSEAGYSIEDTRALARHKNASMTREYIVEDDQKRARAATGLQNLIEEERMK